MSRPKTFKNAISPTRAEDFSQWYQQVIAVSGLAESSVSRGCMVIKPWGYGVWELIQRYLDNELKRTGHENAYFPLLIPLSLLEKEASHIEGFAKECAVVTHSRLVGDKSGGLVPSAPLREPYIIRPTSEAIIGATYARWVQSYRDLPIMINQWANVMRWEMRTRLFLRTSEFLWQEGHTVHATPAEAAEESQAMIELYRDFVTDHLALPVVMGVKTPDERFPGAQETYTIEALMQDGKALQAGTSHDLGQNFSKAYDISFQDRQGRSVYPWTTSWGVSTRLIGAMVMTHSDDDGLVLPPRVAPQQVVLMPILSKGSDEHVLSYARDLRDELESQLYQGSRVRVHMDERDIRPGEKNWHHIKRGVPVRVEIGRREVETGTLNWCLRHQPHRQKHSGTRSELVEQIGSLLAQMQDDLLGAAQKYRDTNTHSFIELTEYEKALKGNPGLGWARLPWCPGAMDHPFLKKYSLTPRCLPLSLAADQPDSPPAGTLCAFTAQPATAYALIGRAY